MANQAYRKTCRAHCGACGQHFSSVSAFDAHRVGSADARRCLPAVEAALEVQSTWGVCEIGGAQAGLGVSIWSSGFEGFGASGLAAA